MAREIAELAQHRRMALARRPHRKRSAPLSRKTLKWLNQNDHLFFELMGTVNARSSFLHEIGGTFAGAVCAIIKV